jgi:hypothetical protein
VPPVVAAVTDPIRIGWAGLAACGLSVALTFAVAAAGPSLLEPALPGQPGQPPWSLAVYPAPALVTALTAAAILAGAAGLALAIAAMRRGWALRPAGLLAAGLGAALALAAVPPIGSADPLSYAAYGRLAAAGHDPYVTAPAAPARRGDPVAWARQAVPGGQAVTSVYGPLATAGQVLAARIGGPSVRLTVFILGLLNIAAFAVTGLLLHGLARGDPRRQQRAALLWTANPLLLQVLVAGGHVDSQAIVLAVAALAVFARAIRAGQASGPGGQGQVPRSGQSAGWLRAAENRTAAAASPGGVAAAGPGASWRAGFLAAAAGALAGLGGAVKVSVGLVAFALALAGLAATGWHRRPGGLAGPRRRWLLAGLGAGFALTTLAALSVWGPGSLEPALRASGQASIGSPWRAVRSALRLAVGETAAENVVRAAAALLAVALLILMLRAITGATSGLAGPRPRLSASPETAIAATGATLTTASVASFALAVVVAWLFAWPYVLPWYDGLAWTLLALSPVPPFPGARSRLSRRAGLAGLPERLDWLRLDWLLLARTTALALGYLPGRGCYRGAPACQAGAAVAPGLGWLETVVRTGVTPVVLLVVTAALARALWPGRGRHWPGAHEAGNAVVTE